MKLKGNIYRKDGQWVIEIESKAWIIGDILYDIENRMKPVPVKIVIAENPYSFGGTTDNSSYRMMETTKPKVITADVGFTVDNKEAKE